LGVSLFAPFALSLTKPFGVPAFLSLAFWGGIWGMVFASIEGRFPHGIWYWISAFLFGAIVASMVALTIVLPLKGKPMGGGWHLSLLATAFLANGAWGLGTGAFFRAFKGWLGKHHHQAPV